MLMQAVDTYLAVRRTVGFALVPIESYLRNSLLLDSGVVAFEDEVY